MLPGEANVILQQQFNELQRQWETYKNSSTTVHNHRLATNAVDSSIWWDEWGPVDDVRNINETVRERRAAVKSGKLKGRCLLEALDKVAAEDQKNEEEKVKEIGTINCSSELIQESDEIRGIGTTMSCCTTSEDSTAGKAEEGEEIEIELSGTVALKECGGTCLVAMARWFVLLVVVAVGFVLFLEFHGDHEDWSIPPT